MIHPFWLGYLSAWTDNNAPLIAQFFWGSFMAGNLAYYRRPK